MKLGIAGFTGRLFLWFWLSFTLLIVANFYLTRYLDHNTEPSPPSAQDLKKLEHISERFAKSDIRPIDRLLRSHLSRNLIIIDPQTGAPLRTQRGHWRLAPLFESNQVQVMELRPGHKIIGPFTISTLERDYRAFWAMPPEHIPAWRAQLQSNSQWRLAISAVLVLILSLVLARWLSRPVKTLAQAVRQFGNGKLDTRVSEGRGEFGQLAREFNNMATKLQASMDSQQRLVADVSHELRSPLTRLKLAAGILSEQVQSTYVQRIEKECDTLDHLIEQVLTLARLEGSIYQEQSAAVNLTNIVSTSVEDWRFQMPDTTIVYEPRKALFAQCKPHLMQRILDNLLGNASRYSEKVWVELDSNTEHWTLVIADNGPGVDEAQIEHLFEPFYRADSARAHDGNFGLGLAITQAAAAAQGIDICASKSPEGGLNVVLTGAIKKAPAE
ncbi:HAMP domain-containing protein [Gilvimarinus agarilyticus]|uniref:sensor histidine kinase n=1 Tax=Gilvimarinus sp. 2_MG-2023 TaxID=3062666 RepID=UPI001C09436C|nr:ATP-binding protein [Gilvimarinus sp. 2_MG-2023]MBU2886889.1 HAMP domain-containing protein [Gilvimarinus agarilyticus]MDO6571550.1 histidine kinase dimerization/phospho-acceptor domain-containing protein [Gilvimarinus sp. 2_MG-2023]